SPPVDATVVGNPRTAFSVPLLHPAARSMPSARRLTMDQGTSSPDLTTAILADACHLRIPSQPDWITPTVDYLIARALRSGAIDPDRDHKLTIALHEALTNAIIHGNLGISSELKERGDEEFFRAVRERMADPDRASRVVDIQASYDGRAARWV